LLAWIGTGVGVSNGNALHAVAMLSAGLMLGAIGLWLRVTQPVAYRLDRDALVIERRRGSLRITGRIEPHTDKARLGLRLGSGGLYGYRGHFRVAGGGWTRSFVTDVRRTVLIKVGRRRVVLSPIDPAGLVEVVRNA